MCVVLGLVRRTYSSDMAAWGGFFWGRSILRTTGMPIHLLKLYVANGSILIDL